MFLLPPCSTLHHECGASQKFERLKAACRQGKLFQRMWASSVPVWYERKLSLSKPLSGLKRRHSLSASIVMSGTLTRNATFDSIPTWSLWRRQTAVGCREHRKAYHAFQQHAQTTDRRPLLRKFKVENPIWFEARSKRPFLVTLSKRAIWKAPAHNMFEVGKRVTAIQIERDANQSRKRDFIWIGIEPPAFSPASAHQKTKAAHQTSFLHTLTVKVQYNRQLAKLLSGNEVRGKVAIAAMQKAVNFTRSLSTWSRKVFWAPFHPDSETL